MNSPIPQDSFYKEKIEDLTRNLYNSSYQTETWIIILLLILNITLRIPITPSPVGTDTYKTIWEIKWILNYQEPILAKGRLAVLHGLYTTKEGFEYIQTRGPKAAYYFTDPFIYQTNIALLIHTTGLELIDSLLFFDIFCGVLAFLSSYIMAKSFVENKFMVYVIAFTYSTAPIFLHETTWQGTFRTLFTAILPLLFWSFFKNHLTGKKKYMLFSIFIGFTLYATHRMGLMLPLYYPAFALSIAYPRIVTFLEGKSRIVDKFLPYFFPTLYVLMFSLFSLYPFFSNMIFFQSMKYDYSEGLLTSGFQTPRVMLNMIVDYYSRLGLLMIFSLIGFIILVEKLRRPVKNKNYLVIAFSLLFSAPFFLNGEYMTIYLMPIFSVLISLGVKGFFSFIETIAFSLKLSYQTLQFVVTMFFISSCMFSIFMNYWWTTSPYSTIINVNNWMDERVKQSVPYIDQLPGTIIIPQFTNILTQLSAMSEVHDKLFWAWENYGWGLHTNQNIIILHYYNITYALEYGEYKKSWVNLNSPAAVSPLLVDLDNERDRVYSNGVIGLYESKIPQEDFDRMGLKPGELEDISRFWLGT